MTKAETDVVATTDVAIADADIRFPLRFDSIAEELDLLVVEAVLVGMSSEVDGTGDAMAVPVASCDGTTHNADENKAIVAADLTTSTTVSSALPLPPFQREWLPLLQAKTHRTFRETVMYGLLALFLSPRSPSSSKSGGTSLVTSGKFLRELNSLDVATLFDLPVAVTTSPRVGIELTCNTGPLRPLVDWMTVVLQSMGTDLSDVTIKGDGCPIVESSSVCSLVMDVHARMGRGDDDDDRMMRGLRETGLRVFGRRAVVERVAMHARRVCG